VPLYMDHHKNVEGLTAEAVAEAHAKDLEAQEKHGVNLHKVLVQRGEGRGLLPGRGSERGSGGRRSHGGPRPRCRRDNRGQGRFIAP